MFVACVRFMLSVILSPRRLLIAALLATFLYAALVATKARFFPDPSVRPGKPVAAASTPSGRHGAPAPAETRSR